MGNGVWLPQTTYENRSEMYVDVEKLISPGFISTRVKVFDTYFNLRTFCSGDMNLLENREKRDSRDARDWIVTVLSHATWMVNGISILGDINTPIDVSSLYKRLPNYILKRLYRIQSSLSDKIGEAVKYIRCYSMEDPSRNAWRVIGNSISLPTITGIPGTEIIGLNPIQKLWIIYNKHFDSIEEGKQSWNTAKFIASSNNPKGVKKVEDKEKARELREEDSKQELLDKTYYTYIGALREDKLSDGRSIQRRVKTIDELANEYKNWVEGNMDEFDMIVNEHKRKIREKFIAEKDSPRLQIVGDDSPTKMMAFDMNQIINRPAGVKMVNDEVSKHRSSIRDDNWGDDDLQNKISNRKPVVHAGKPER
jgi:hypothetical protein